jgi:hypothetical protein
MWPPVEMEKVLTMMVLVLPSYNVTVAKTRLISSGEGRGVLLLLQYGDK